MKKIIAILCSLMFVISMGITAYGASTSPNSVKKLTTRETKIAKAYLKTLETFDAKYLNAVKYPGVTFQTDGLSEGVTVKVLNPVFTKAKDETLKLDRLDVSGLLIVCSSEKLALANVTQGMAIKTLKKQVYAFQEVDVKTDEVKAIGDLDEGTKTALVAFLGDLYGAETADFLIENYASGAFSEDTGAGTGSENAPADTPTPTPAGK